jgi:hypothetical protein
MYWGRREPASVRLWTTAMNFSPKRLELFSAGGIEAILKTAEQVQAERRDRQLALASSHRFDLIGREADAKPTALAVLEIKAPHH